MRLDTHRVNSVLAPDIGSHERNIWQRHRIHISLEPHCLPLYVHWRYRCGRDGKPECIKLPSSLTLWLEGLELFPNKFIVRCQAFFGQK